MVRLHLVALLALVGLLHGMRHERSKTSQPEDYVEVLAGTDTPDGGAPSNGNVLPQLKRPHGMNDWVPLTNPSGGAHAVHPPAFPVNR